jgi:hypothetical protein
MALYWSEAENVSTTGKRTKLKGSPLALTYLRHHEDNLVKVKFTLAGSVGIPDGHPIAPPTIKYILNPVTCQVLHIESDSDPEVTTSSSPSETTPQENVVESSLGFAAKSDQLPTPSSTPKPLDLGLDMARIFLSGTIELVDPLPAHLTKGLDSRGFKDTPRAVAILPINTNSSQGGRNDIRSTLPSAVLVLGLNTRRAYDADYASWLESVGAGLSNQLTVVLQREADTRMIEERERMDKAKTMFFTNVSHGKQIQSFYRIAAVDLCGVGKNLGRP